MAVTAPAATENVAVVMPCGTTTEDGTDAAIVFELESNMLAPPTLAGELRLIVPVADWPLTIVAGETDRLPNIGGGGLTTRPNVCVTPE